MCFFKVPKLLKSKNNGTKLALICHFKEGRVKDPYLDESLMNGTLGVRGEIAKQKQISASRRRRSLGKVVRERGSNMSKQQHRSEQEGSDLTVNGF